MLSLPPTVKIFLCTQPADMRKSFDGLKGLVEEFLQQDALSRHRFVFRNRRGERGGVSGLLTGGRLPNQRHHVTTVNRNGFRMSPSRNGSGPSHSSIDHREAAGGVHSLPRVASRIPQSPNG